MEDTSEVYVICVNLPGCLPEQDPYAVYGADMAYDCAQNELGDVDSLGYSRAEWLSALQAGGASVYLESGYVLEVTPLNSLGLPDEDRADYLEQAGIEQDPRPEEGDGYVNEPAYGSCVVSLDGRNIGQASDVDGAFRILAARMWGDGYFPNVWHVNERGNTTLVALEETGTYTFTDTAYV